MTRVEPDAALAGRAHERVMPTDCSTDCNWPACTCGVNERREVLLGKGYKADSRCTWLAIGRCSECDRVHDGGAKACGSNGTVDCQSTPANQRCAACPHKVPRSGCLLCEESICDDCDAPMPPIEQLEEDGVHSLHMGSSANWPESLA